MNIINNVCSKAHNGVSLLFRGFISRDIRTITNAYKIYVRPLLEYCSSLLFGVRGK